MKYKLNIILSSSSSLPLIDNFVGVVVINEETKMLYYVGQQARTSPQNFRPGTTQYTGPTIYLRWKIYWRIMQWKEYMNMRINMCTTYLHPHNYNSIYIDNFSLHIQVWKLANIQHIHILMWWLNFYIYNSKKRKNATGEVWKMTRSLNKVGFLFLGGKVGKYL